MGRASKKLYSKLPERRCIVSRSRLPKAQLIRFVVNPEGVMTPDIEEKLPGRGYWVKSERQALMTVERMKLFNRTARKDVETPNHLAELVDARLSGRVIQLLALARKSGRTTTGFEKVKEILSRGGVEVFLQARDGSPGQKAKLSARFPGSHFFDCLDQSELGMAFGRESVVYVAVRKGPIVKKMLLELCRLAGLRNVSMARHVSTLEPAMS